MLPKLILFNSVSVDAAIKDFPVDVALHYEVAGKIKADATLVGSNTAKTGIEMFMETIPSEEPDDFQKPKVEADDLRPIWVIADSKGVLSGLVHVYRKSGYCKDVIVLVSSKTSKDYLNYLKARNYDFILAGEDHVNYQLALEELNRRYGVKRVMTDTGGILGSVLIDNELVDEIQLLISPFIVGKKATNLFRSLNTSLKLKLLQAETCGKNHVLVKYKVLKNKKKTSTLDYSALGEL